MAVHGLFIGINQYGGPNLRGCVNDAKDWAHAFPRADSHVLLLDRQATRRGVLGAVALLLGRLASGDWGIITFSGHGTYLADSSGDEADGRDEALVCADLEPIVDDEFAGLLGARRKGSRLLVVTDSCHSGTVHRMFHIGPLDGPRSQGRPRFLAPSRLARPGGSSPGRPRRPRPAALDDVLHLAGCLDSEYSYDGVFRGRANGALSRVGVDTLRRLPHRGSFNAWFISIGRLLPSRDYPQHPCVNATRASLRLRVPR